MNPIKNYAHQGKTHLRQEVEDGYIFYKYYCKKQLTILPIIFYVTLINRSTVIIEPTGKPIILEY